MSEQSLDKLTEELKSKIDRGIKRIEDGRLFSFWSHDNLRSLDFWTSCMKNEVISKLFESVYIDISQISATNKEKYQILRDKIVFPDLQEILADHEKNISWEEACTNYLS